MVRDAAHSSMFRTSDFIGLLIVVCGGLVEYAFLWEWSLPLPPWIRIAAGVAVGCPGIALIAAGRAALGKADQPSEPGRPTTRIVRSGVFRHTRNPTYLGLVALLLGIGIAANYIAWILGSVLAVLAMHYLLVIPEEEYLMARFPDEFRHYATSVRRWV